MTNWLLGLNREQQAAVQHVHGPLLILAGAGSGKTTVLVSRTGYILENQYAKPEEMCVLTFTNKAARELVHRVNLKLGKRSKGLWTGTFHSFGLQILRKYHEKARLPQGFGILDAGDAQGLVKELLMDIKNYSKESYKVETLLSEMSEWRARGQTRLRDSEDEYEVMVEVLLPKYLKRLELLGVVDFDGLILKPLELLQKDPEVLAFYQNKFKFMMVDEFQDTSSTQYQFIHELVKQHGNIAVVGDDDQSIYGWRGAEISNILDFPKNFKNTEVIRLERNYRSTPAILHIANEVIKNNDKRHGKVLKSDPDAEPGHKPEVFYYENEDVETEEVIRHVSYFIQQGFLFRDIAILYRSNGQGAMLETLLRQNQIPYVLTGGTGFFDRKESKDLLGYLRCSVRPNELAFRRIMNVPPRGLGETAVHRIEEFAKLHDLSFVDASKRSAEIGVTPKQVEALQSLWQRLHGLADELIDHHGYETSSDALYAFVKQIGYAAHMRSMCKDDSGFQNRWIAVEVLGRSLMRSFERNGISRASFMDFIDSMELRDVVDDPHRDEMNEVQLLTLHASKGLEFPAVIIIGIEEEIIPHRILGQNISEERRLFYVGLTRAKKRLVLTASRQRKRYGKWVPSSPSRFMLEVPSDSVHTFTDGFRPVNEVQKQTLLSDLMAKLDLAATKQKVVK